MEKELDYKKQIRILDVGCCTGRHAPELTKRGYNVTGIDLSESQIKHAKEKAIEADLIIDFQQHDARNLPFKNEFKGLKKELERILEEFNPVIEHIGSTLIPDLAAKPIIEIAVGLKDNSKVVDFKTVYRVGEEIPHDRINNLRLCHIHIWVFDSLEWTRHIAFREYLLANNDVLK